MDEITITMETADTPMNYQKTSGMLLTALREFYSKPENEEAFQRWKAEREEKAG